MAVPIGCILRVVRGIPLRESITKRFSTAPAISVNAGSLPQVGHSAQLTSRNGTSIAELSDKTREFMQAQNFNKFTDIQRSAIPILLRGKNAVLMAGTGTGKTLAYVIPVVEQLKAAEHSEGKSTRVQRPRALIVVPTRELAIQVLSVCKSISHHVKLRCVGVLGGKRQSLQRKDFDSAVDVVVGTPGRLALLYKQQYFHVGDVRHVVVDEADTLYDAKMGFMEDLSILLTPLQKRAAGGDKPVQAIFTAATALPPVLKRIQRAFPDVVTVRARSTHKIPTLLQQSFITVGPDPTAKHTALQNILAQHARPSSKERFIIFCNSVPSARSTAHFVTELGYNNASLHGDIPPMLRAKEFNAFKGGEADILICTDAAARGLDMPDVTHVINFDFPRSPVDYLHRVGRVARAGKRGVATSLIQGADRPLANKMRDAADKQAPVLLETDT